ncbi:Cytochrome C oxidase subunit IV [Parafrankia irregularis]|uniref:Cytochrome C oxidase subunit IV n=1 Tax=Parafrankia irregularis TaxID=795642 RepID=A0A0S4QTY9_9ACTN|nr:MULTISPECIES: cytochrome C oxidase subunit IV family protein [Parafrankia]MBE3202728.1 cytochrome C oxidase subunit IV family protein [Parafrankia sp. CH37]CUU57914.1 Cytochrome C oxidase subunit IV [Parafrankia irregularis]
MLSASNKRLFAAWIVLSAITAAYLWIDHSADDHGTPIASTSATVGAIVLALVKVRIIMREFMEVRHAPRLLCRLTDLWVVLMAAGLLGMYFAGKAVA